MIFERILKHVCLYCSENIGFQILYSILAVEFSEIDDICRNGKIVENWCGGKGICGKVQC